MKVTKENGSAVVFESDSEFVGRWASVCFDGYSTPRVLEFPKFWRENGKQYKVTECAIAGGSFRTVVEELKVLRLPMDSSFCHENDLWGVKIERY